MRGAILTGICGLAVAGTGANTLTWDRDAERQGRAALAATVIQDALAAYTAGDDLAVERWLSTPDGLKSLADVERALARPAEWNKAKAAFLLEIAILHPIRSSGLIAAGRSMVVSRPTPLGGDAVEDRFEVLWHHAAIAIRQSMPQVTLLQEYLDAVGARFESARRRGVTFDTRFALARANAAAIACCWTRVPGQVVRQIPRSARSGATLAKALELLDEAAGVPALRPEALIRGGKLLFDAGRAADALGWFERVPPHGEPALGYVHHLTLGRVFDALDRSADAAAAYEAALTFAPSGQRAGIGLAAALLRSGRAEQAERAAADARRMADDTGVHFERFNLGDLRLVPDWLKEIRRLRR